MAEEKRYTQQPAKKKSTLWAKRGCQQSSRGVLIFLPCKLSTLIPGTVSDRNQIFSVLDTRGSECCCLLASSMPRTLNKSVVKKEGHRKVPFIANNPSE